MSYNSVIVIAYSATGRIQGKLQPKQTLTTHSLPYLYLK